MQTNQKPRGLQQILSDAGTYRYNDIMKAAKLAVVATLKKTGAKISLTDMEEIAGSVAKLISEGR